MNTSAPINADGLTPGDTIYLPPAIQGPVSPDISIPIGPEHLAPPTVVTVTTAIDVNVVDDSDGEIDVSVSSMINVIERQDGDADLNIKIMDNVRISGDFAPSATQSGDNAFNIEGGSTATYQHFGGSDFQLNSTASIDANLTGCGSFTLSTSTTLDLKEGCGGGQDFYLNQGLMVVDHGADFSGSISLDTTVQESAQGGASVEFQDVTSITSYDYDNDGHLRLFDGTTVVQTVSLDDHTGGNFHVVEMAGGGTEITTGAPPAGGTLITQSASASAVIGVNQDNLTLDAFTFIHGANGIDATDGSSITGSIGKLTFNGGSDADQFGINGKGDNDTLVNFHSSDMLTIAISDFNTSWAETDNGKETSLTLTATSKIDATQTASVTFNGYGMADVNTRLAIDASTTSSLVVHAT